MAQEQSFNAKMAQAKQVQDRINAQIKAQVDAWKHEIEDGNHIIGMMLAETHPKIVTYEFEYRTEFGKTPVMPVFHWPEAPAPDETLEKEAAQAEAQASGMTEKEISDLLALAKMAQAGEGKTKTEAEMKAAMAEMAKGASKKGGMTPEERADAKEKLSALEKAKADWERMEREIAQGFRPSNKTALPGTDPSGYREYKGEVPVPKRTKVSGIDNPFFVGQRVILQMRGGPVALDIRCEPKKNFTPAEFDSICADGHMLEGISEGYLKVGDYQSDGGGSRWNAYDKETTDNLVEKFMKHSGGTKFQVTSVRLEEASGDLIIGLSG